MKKKVVAAILATVLSLSAFTACGKSETEKLADQLQKDYGMSEEEAQFAAEVAQELAGDSDGSEDPKEEESISIKLAEPKSEIVNSDLNDLIVQVEDNIIPTDGSMTVKEVLDTLKSSYDFDFKALIDMGREDLTGDSLISGNYFSSYVRVEDPEGDTILDMWYLIENTDKPSVIYDQKVCGIEVGDACGIYALNVFYPGNICPAIYNIRDKYKETEEYKGRLSQYPLIKYAELESFVQSKGVPYEFAKGGTEVTATTIWEKPVKHDDEDYYVQVEYRFAVNESAGAVDNIFLNNTGKRGTDTLKTITDPKDLPEEEFNSIKEELAQKVVENFYTKGTSAEAVGYVSRDGFFCMVFKTDLDEYMICSSTQISKCYDGTYKKSMNSAGSPMGAAYPTVEEAVTNYGESMDNYISLEN